MTHLALILFPHAALGESHWNKSEAPERNLKFLKRLAPFAPSSSPQGAPDGTDHKVGPPSLCQQKAQTEVGLHVFPFKALLSSS